MAQRTLVALLISLPFVFQVSDSRARPIEVTVDGCAMLARAIYSEVSSSAIYGPGNAGPWLIEQERGDIELCEHVARTVSQAFTSAMMSAGIDVDWRRDRNDDFPAGQGHYCLHAFLSQCNPKRYPPSGSASSRDDSVVQKTWAIVAQAVMREMYNPISSDEVSFRSNDLKLRLGLSLRSISGSGDR
jgi:hypothetical protein